MSRVVASAPEYRFPLNARGVGRRWAFAAALAAIAGSAVGIGFALRPSPGPGAPRPLTSSRQVGKLSVSVPRGFSSYAFYVGDGAPQTPGYAHVLTNFRLPPHTTTGPPSNQVGIQLQRWNNFADVPVRLHLPLNPDQPWGHQPLAQCPAGCSSGLFRAQGRTYLVTYWSGAKAPVNDRVAILRALRSIRPTR